MFFANSYYNKSTRSHFIFLHTLYNQIHIMLYKQNLGGSKMSDLTATNCGCSNNSNYGGNGGGCSWIIWILLLSCFCGGNNGGGCGFGNILGSNNGCGCNDGCGNSSCEWLIWILLLSCFCGGNNNSRCC